jgi:hypothetical protein
LSDVRVDVCEDRGGRLGEVESTDRERRIGTRVAFEHDVLATVIRSARSQARQGDVFTLEIAQMIRRAVRQGCEGDYAVVVALIREEYDKPMPVPVVNGRWPADVPLPTMLPDLLAALPPLPAGLQYRFLNTALVLLDIDANLIIDFVPEPLPITTEAHDAG